MASWRSGPVFTAVSLCAFVFLFLNRGISVMAARVHSQPVSAGVLSQLSTDFQNSIGGKVRTVQNLLRLRSSPNRLFVFGDSYVDNGNRNRTSGSVCWNRPYGDTWPGHPSGRCSDGKVLSDWLAQIMEISSPILYRELSKIDSSEKKRHIASQGINFAVVGSGVFRDFGHKTLHGQIGWLKKLLDQGIVEKEALKSTLFLVSTSSNDYYNFVTEKTTPFGLPSYISQVVDALGEGIQRLAELGAEKIVVSNLMPFGCLPAVKEIAHVTNCFVLANTIPTLHNIFLSCKIKKLRRSLPSTTIVMADFNKIFKDVGTSASTFGFDKSFEACCDTDGGGIRCGNNNSSYIICKKPNRNFFWDAFHLTQAGSHVVAKLLFEGDGYTDPKPNLKELF